MILFLLLTTSIIFVRYFYQIGITRMGIIPIATIVALFFGTGMSSTHRSWMNGYLETHLQSFSWLLILVGVQIMFSLFQISRTESSIILIVLNTILLYITYFQNNRERQPTLRAWIIFQSIIYLISSAYFAYLYDSFAIVVILCGMLVALLAGLRSFLYRIIGIFVDLDEHPHLQYEVLLLYHILLVLTILHSYRSTSEFQWLIIIQLYVALLFMSIGFIKQYDTLGASTSDLDVQYILRWYTINQLPGRITSRKWRFSHPHIQGFIRNIPESMYLALSLTSVAVTSIVCGLIVYFGSLGELNFGDFWMFLLNTGLYLIIFYFCKKMGINDKLRRMFGFIMINVCFYVAVAHVFAKDTVSILFWSLLWSVANNITMNYLQELRQYLNSSDFTYRLFSNFLGLLIILYFFLSLPLDTLLKVAISIVMVGLWMLMNKDNLKMIFQKEKVM